jgi:adiponectin receptor
MSRQRRQSSTQVVVVTEELSFAMSKIKIRQQILVSFHEMPIWHQDNHLVLHGYRPESNSIRACIESWLYLHNETVNIYTHLIPSILFLAAEGIIDRYFNMYYPKATLGDRIVFGVFFLAGAICMGMSAAYHTFMNHSMHVSHLMLRMDFVGIVILIVGKFVSGIYVGFYCEPLLMKTYWSMVCTIYSLMLV